MTPEKDTEVCDKSTSIEIVKMYFDEWKYRHENFWKRLTEFTVITFFTISMPFTYRIFSGLELPGISMLFYPIFGALLSLVSCLFSLSEYARLKSVDNTIKEIINTHLGKSLAKQSLPPSKFGKLLDMNIGVWIPCILTAMQIALAILIILMITKNKI